MPPSAGLRGTSDQSGPTSTQGAAPDPATASGRTGSHAENVDPIRRPEPAGLPQPTAPAEITAASIFYRARTAAEGLLEAERRFGADDYAVNALRMQAKFACSEPVDPSGSLNLPSADPSRDWAIEALVDFCAGWDATRFAPVRSGNAPRSLLAIARERGPEAALNEAEQRLSTSTDGEELLSASLLMLERNRLPTPQQLGLPPGALGTVDQTNALSYASRMLACTLAGGCGPGAVTTLRYCREFGCTPGSDLMSAVRENTPPPDYQLILAYYHWLVGRRGRGG